MKSISVSPYKERVTKNLLKLLKSEQKHLNQKYEFNHDMFSFIRQHSIRLKESPLDPNIRLEFIKNRKFYILTFYAGSYPDTQKGSDNNLFESFPFQLSYNVKYDSLLTECFANDFCYSILRGFVTTHPITVKRKEFSFKTLKYRGPLPSRMGEEICSAFKERFEDDGIDLEFIKKCMDIARDKEERLRSEWIDSIIKFINS